MRTVIIGNGVAGNSAAEFLRRLDPDGRVTIIEAGPDPFYSACALPRLVGGECRERDVIIRRADEAERLGIELRLGQRVQTIEAAARQVRLEGESLAYDRLIVATGSRALLPNLPGTGLSGVFTLKTLTDARTLMAWRGSRVAVVGAGPVGVEAAAALRSLGKTVVLLEMRESILPDLLAPEFGAAVADLLKEKGIEIATGSRLEAIEGDRAVRAVRANSGHYPCDTVLFAGGVRAENRLAQAAGIILGERGGILVDEHLETSIPGIFAGGDGAEFGDAPPAMLWVNAKRQGWLAGMNALGHGRRYPGQVQAVALNLYGSAIFSARLPEVGARDGLEILRQEGRGWQARFILRDGRPIEAQFVGSPTREYGSVLARLVNGQPGEEIRGLSPVDFRRGGTNAALWGRALG